MIQLKDVEKIDESTFKIRVLHNQKLKTYLVSCKYHFVKSLREEMMYLNSNDKDFYDVWGQSLDFRQEVFKKINQLKEAEIHESQLTQR